MSTTGIEPDPDAIKMFVGQIPRSMDEESLRKMFSEYGPVYQLNVLRDKQTGQSKGCCFVTFFTRKAALEAQNALHNMKTMPGMQHPIQMKPADSEKRNIEERKLFVGMLSKKYTEHDVRMIFASFGAIEECTVLQDHNGQSKGCAFVTFASRQSAQNAIKAMHHSQTMEGCRAPLVVKLADTPKEKEAKKMQQLHQQGSGLMSGSGVGNLAPQYLAQMAAAAGNLGTLGNMSNIGVGLNQQQMFAAAMAALQTSGGDASSFSNMQNPHLALSAVNPNQGVNSVTPQSMMMLQQLVAALGINSSSSQQSYSNTGHLPSGSGTSQSGLGGSHGSLSHGGLHNNIGSMHSSGVGQPTNVNGISTGTVSLTHQANDNYTTNMQQFASPSFGNTYSGSSSHMTQISSGGGWAAGKQTEGPDGCNLFIYHLPQEIGDHELLQMFAPFGNVLSAKVFIDKQTNLSKCFGFVSYDNPLSAATAIQSMNGFQIASKRLKVQLKRPKNDNKSY